ncbi:MAG: o-succinylbenzoate synthase [Isosphaeraceae bacterium]|jgi:O-succinylbenzoate synthase|nr:MAG: o-succinylbenzoate synthase [Isosphaeraceae bacterium]
MRVDRVDLWEVRLPLIRPFRTSSSQRAAISHIVVRVEVDGIPGWGECVAPIDPYYCEETTGTCWLILTEFLIPAVLNRDWSCIDDFRALYSRVKGNRFAKAGLESAVCVAEAARAGLSLARWLGGTRSLIQSGVSLGIEDDLGRLTDLIAEHLAQGYRRVKLKIAPGHDIDVVRHVRRRYPDLPLQVDANSAYSLEDADHLAQLDAFNLLLIEQPLAHDDIVDHARLQARLQTAICLDESLRSLADVRHALEIDACRIVNIKPGRVGGLIEARAIHDLCLRRGVPVWCGGMHEFGIGRAVNLALASLPGFTLPGDVSGSDKYYAQDLVEPPILASNGQIPVPDTPGLGHQPSTERIQAASRRHWSSLKV